MSNKTQWADWLIRSGCTAAQMAPKVGVSRPLIAQWCLGVGKPDPRSPYWPILLDELGLSAEERAEAHRLAGVDPLWLLTPEERAQVSVRDDMREAA